MKQIASMFFGLLIVCFSCKTNPNRQLGDQNKDYKETRFLAFQNEEHIFCLDLSTGKAKDIIEGYDPCISPDCKWIAYTEYQNSGTDFTRTIKLINLQTFSKKDLNIANHNHYGPIWSPNNDYIAFSIMEDDWQIGLLKLDDLELKRLRTQSNGSLCSPTWSPDGKYIFTHNLSTLFKFNTKGDLVDKFDLEELLGDNFYFSSSTRFVLTSDNSTILFDCGIDEYIEGLDEPITAIFSYNFNTKRVKRITKNGLSTVDLWVDKQDRIYFSVYENIKAPLKIYQTSLSDTTMNIFITNGSRPTIGGQ